jgi:hypothetical protein
VLIGVTLLVLGVVGQAGAILLEGNDIGFEWLYPDTSTTLVPPTEYTVGAGVEIPDVFGSTTTSIDFSDANIVITWAGVFTSTSGFNGPHFFDASAPINPFTSVDINPVTNVSGFDISSIAFGDDFIWI